MRMVRDRADARWLPSRFNVSTLRLLALLIMSRSVPKEQRGLVLVIDRHQSSIESHAVASGAVVMGICFFTAMLSARLTMVAALLLSVPLTLAAYSFVVVAGALMIEPLMRRAGVSMLLAPRLNGLVHTGLLFAAALYFVTRASWVRPLAVVFLAALAVNLFAALLMLFMRGRMAELDRRYGVQP